MSELDPQPITQLVEVLLQSGTTPSQVDIIECIHWGNPSILEVLLRTGFENPIKLNREAMYTSSGKTYPELLNETYGGKDVGALWELGRSNQVDFKGMLDVLLRRGEQIDNKCGPRGETILHALIIGERWGNDCSVEGVKILKTRGANLDVRNIFKPSPPV